ncbi:MAG: immune inhibitor A [Anaerolineales bacterium]|nr:immune inhibitor A [Anaerolineales bacterium]
MNNGNFDSGRTAWRESTAVNNKLICTSTSCGTAINPHTQRYLAWLGGDNSETSQISQRIRLPAEPVLRLSYWYRVKSTDMCNYDYANLRLTVDGITRTLKTYNLCASRNTSTWVNAQIDLSAYAGKTVDLIFRVRNDATAVSSFFVDDVAIVNPIVCQSSAAPLRADNGPGVDSAPSAQTMPAVPASAAQSQQ